MENDKKLNEVENENKNENNETPNWISMMKRKSAHIMLIATTIGSMLRGIATGYELWKRDNKKQNIGGIKTELDSLEQLKTQTKHNSFSIPLQNTLNNDDNSTQKNK